MGNVDLLFENGSVGFRSISSISIKNFSIIQIPVYLRLYEINNLIKYTVSLWNSDNENQIMTRTFIVQKTNYLIQEFFLQNKYGVLEYFYTENQKIESNIKGDNVVKDNLLMIDITEKNKIFTVNTGAKSYDCLKVIAQAAKNEHNFIIFQKRLIPISILPESISLLDETKDIQSTSFKFQFNDENTEDVIAQNLIESSVMLPDHTEVAAETIHLNPTESVWSNTVTIEGSDESIALTWENAEILNEINTTNIWK
jgi:hypothetical protein